jgi:hypothetical protein
MDLGRVEVEELRSLFGLLGDQELASAYYKRIVVLQANCCVVVEQIYTLQI